MDKLNEILAKAKEIYAIVYAAMHGVIGWAASVSALLALVWPYIEPHLVTMSVAASQPTTTQSTLRLLAIAVLAVGRSIVPKPKTLPSP